MQYTIEMRIVNLFLLPKPLRALLPVVVLFLLVQGWAWGVGVNYTWTGNDEPDNWNNPSNWSPSGVPDVGDTAIIPNGVTFTMDIDTPASLRNEGNITGNITVGGNLEKINYGMIKNAAITVGGNLISGSNYNAIESTSISVVGNLINNNSSTIESDSITVGGYLNNSGGNLILTGSLTVTGTLDNGSGSGGGTISTNSISALSTIYDKSGSNRGTIILIVDSTQSTTFAIDVSTLKITDTGELIMNGKDLIVGSGGFSNEGTLTLSGEENLTKVPQDTDSGTMKFTGGTGLCGLTSFFNLEIAGSSVTSSNSITVSGNLTITSGATLSSEKEIRVRGDWSNSGTFSSTGGTVELTGDEDHTVSGNNTFFMFTITDNGSNTTTFTGENTFRTFTCTFSNKTVKFPRDKTQTVTGTFTFGSSSGRNTLSAYGAGNEKWMLNAGSDKGKYNITYTDISEGIAGTDLGWDIGDGSGALNREGFATTTENFFKSSADVYIWTGNASTQWDKPENWNPASVPGKDAIIGIPPTVNQPILTSNVTVKTITVWSGAIFDMGNSDVTADIANLGTVRLISKGQNLTGARTNGEGSTVEYYGTQFADAPAWGVSYENLVINKTAGGSWEAANAVTVKKQISNPPGDTGDINFNGGLTVGGDAVFNTTGTLRLGGAISSFAGGLTVAGPANIAGTVSSGTPGKNITFIGPITLDAHTTFTTNNGAVSLSRVASDGYSYDLTIKSGSGAVEIAATVDVRGAVSVTTSGAVTWGGRVTAASVTQLGTDANNLGANTVKVDISTTVGTGGIRFAGPVTLFPSSGTTIALNTSATNGAVSLGAVTGGSNDLTIESGSGAVGLVAITGARAVSVTSSGTVTWGGAVSAASVTQSGTGANTVKANISTTTGTGGIRFAGPVTLSPASGSTVTFNTSANNGAVTFSSTVNGTTANTQSLTITTGTGTSAGKVSFDGAVGGSTALASLSVTSGNSDNDAITIQNVTTSGAQTYTGKVTLGAADTTLTTSNAAITLSDTVTGAGKNFTVSAGTGAVTVGGDIGGDGTARLGEVSISGQGITLNKSDGNKIYTNYQNITLDAGTGTLTSTADQNLTLDVTGTGATEPKITLAADTAINAGTLFLTGTAKLDVHKSTVTGNQAINANITLTKTAQITLDLTSPATGIIQATGKKLALEGGVDPSDSSKTIGATLDLDEHDWLVGTIASSSDEGFYVYLGSTLTAYATSTLTMRGTGKKLSVDNNQPLGNLTISRDTATPDTMVTLGAPLVLLGTMTLKNGDGSGGHALSVSSDNYNIKVGGNWNQKSRSDFEPVGAPPPSGDLGTVNSATVTFVTNPQSDKRTVIIEGYTDWYNLALTYENGIKTVMFSNYDGTVDNNGNAVGHNVRNKLLLAGGPPDPSGNYDAGERLLITRLNDDNINPMPMPVSEPPSSDQSTMDDRWWFFEHGDDVLHSGCENYEVRYSWSSENTVGLIDELKAQYVAYPNYYDVGWFFLGDLFFYSFTEDFDGNGRIDRIRAQGDFLNTDTASLSKFQVTVTGYDVNDSMGTYYGYEFSGSDMLYIWLQEKEYPDTGETPGWMFTNGSLQTTSKKLIQKSSEENIPIDTAPPRISYTLAVPGEREVYVRMSEPVAIQLDDNVANKATFGIGVNDLPGRTFAGYTIERVTDRNLVDLNPSDGYTDEFLLIMTEPIKAADLVDGTFYSVVDFDGLVDRNTRPNKIPDKVKNGVPPKFPKEYPPNDQSAFTFTYVAVSQGDLNPESFKDLNPDFKTEIPNRFNTGAEPKYGSNNSDQRLSDILIMVEPDPDPTKRRSDPHLSIWPLQMRDSSSVNTDSGEFTIGRVERYDGRGRLRPSQIETVFITASGLEKKSDNLGLYFSSISMFDGYVLPDAAISMPTVMSHINKTTGAWLPGPENETLFGLSFPLNHKDLQWAFTPGSKTYTKDHSPKSSAKAIDYSGAESPPMKEIVYMLGVASGRLLYGLRLNTWEGEKYNFPTKWWESDQVSKHKWLKPFNFISLALTPQVSGVTIRNNVIDPTKNEFTALNYELTRRGRVTISVFTLDGTLVRQLVRSVQETGSHDVSWDGLNQGGRPVARGMYFIRVVAPDIDEMRKVMVVK
jgi:hypothetical protein